MKFFSTRTAALTGIWLLSAAIAVPLALVHYESAFVNGEFIPRTNDSFYHARRILDAAVGNGFYEFDPRLHVPDGSWISWPWGYDFLTAQALKAALWLRPQTDPMAFLSYIPVMFVALNTGLFVAAAAQAGLRLPLVFAAALCLSLLPVSQLMHSIGMIDHHFLEFTYVLLATWLGLRWFADRSSKARAVHLGLALGSAVAFHNGLFALQLPLLGCTFVLWLRGDNAPKQATLWLAGTLVAASLAAAAPADAFQSFLFEFALLSWYHVYIGVCTATTLLIMSVTQRSVRSFGILAVVASLLAIPILAQALQGASFVSGEMAYLEQVSEVRSPWEMFREIYGPRFTASFYSWLIVLAPVLLALYAWRCFRERKPDALYFCVWVVFGIGLLLMQYRLHYFGIFALFTGTFALVQETATRMQWRRGLALAASLVIIFVAFQPVLNDRLFVFYAPAADEAYANTRPIYDKLEPLCEADPGLVLASSDDGSPILFHTECSVISNNFIMRPEDEVALNRIVSLMQSSPDEILNHEPPIEYVFLRTVDFALPGQSDGAIRVDERNALAAALLTQDDVPAGFETVHSVYQGTEPGKPVHLFARLLKVVRE